MTHSRTPRFKTSAHSAKKRDRTQRHSQRQELRQKAADLGLPRRKAIFPEGKLSPSYGDPTAVDDRPFARSTP
ncbi:MAG: hypothetical protein SW833_08645 [Cyanobacteriota bacterium]|nr:hypothetical protein [Cyanobacteriota bacterium]